MPEGLSYIMTRKDYNLMQEYKRGLNSTLNDYLNKLNIPIINNKSKEKKKSRKTLKVKNRKHNKKEY